MRDYDPTTGRYIQADPLGLVDGASDPGRYIDPRGEAWKEISGYCASRAPTENHHENSEYKQRKRDCKSGFSGR